MMKTEWKHMDLCVFISNACNKCRFIWDGKNSYWNKTNYTFHSMYFIASPSYMISCMIIIIYLRKWIQIEKHWRITFVSFIQFSCVFLFSFCFFTIHLSNSNLFCGIVSFECVMELESEMPVQSKMCIFIPFIIPTQIHKDIRQSTYY